jgi:hypothetical protein
MKIELNYYSGTFSVKKADFSKIQPFSHADVVVNCNQPLANSRGILERKVEIFLSEVLSPIGVRAKWDKLSEWQQSQPREGNNPPRISKLGLGIDFYI